MQLFVAEKSFCLSRPQWGNTNQHALGWVKCQWKKAFSEAWAKPLRRKSDHRMTRFTLILALPQIGAEAQTIWGTESHLPGHRKPHRVTIMVHSGIKTYENLRFHLLLWKCKSINIDHSFHKERAIVKNNPFLPTGKGHKAKFASLLLLVSLSFWCRKHPLILKECPPLLLL